MNFALIIIDTGNIQILNILAVVHVNNQSIVKPFSDQRPLGYYANNADPVQLLQNVTSNQGLHCLFTGNAMQYTIKNEKHPVRTP